MGNNKIKYLDILQVFRGVAAIMVVLHHSIGSLFYYNDFDFFLLSGIKQIGKFGVDFFFILSGFIITYTSHYKYSDKNVKKYYVNRLLRLYVPYLPIGVALLFLYKLFPNLSSVNRDISWLTSFTLFPHGRPALSVAWTLSHELLFYTVFLLSIISKKIWKVFLFFWILALISFNFFWDIQFEYPIINFLTSFYNFEFILGYFLALIFIKKINIKPCFIVLPMFLFLILFLVNIKFEVLSVNHIDNYLVSLFCCFLIYFCINKDYKFNSSSLLMLLGNASYSIYLLHNPLQALFYKKLPFFNNLTLGVVSLVIVVLLSSLIGYFYYCLFEKKLTFSLKKFFNI